MKELSANCCKQRFGWIALRAGGALMVVRRNQTRVRPLQAFTQKLNDANVMVVGSVLNEN